MKLRTVIATAATAAVLATSGVALAGAATGSGAASPPDQPAASTAGKPAASRTHPVLRHRARVHIRRLRHRAAGVISETIGIDRQTFRQELRSGKTIGEIAADHGVQPQTVIDALVAAASRRIDQAVAHGRISAERATRIKVRLPDRIARIVNEWHPGKFRTSADV